MHVKQLICHIIVKELEVVHHWEAWQNIFLDTELFIFK